MASHTLSLWPVLLLQPTLQSKMVNLSGLCGVRYKSTVTFQEIVFTPHREREGNEKSMKGNTPHPTSLPTLNSSTAPGPCSLLLLYRRKKGRKPPMQWWSRDRAWLHHGFDELADQPQCCLYLTSMLNKQWTWVWFKMMHFRLLLVTKCTPGLPSRSLSHHK